MISQQDTGWAWMVLLGGFTAYFIADGWSFSMSVLHHTLMQVFQESSSKTSLIGAIVYGLPQLLSPFACALITVYGCRIIGIIGGILFSISFFLSYFSSSVDFLIIMTGIVGTCGLSLTYLTALIAVTLFFEKRRALATSIAVTGSALGSIAIPPLFGLLIDFYSWQGSLLFMCGIALHIIPASGLFRPINVTSDEKAKNPLLCNKYDNNLHQKQNDQSGFTYLKQKSKSLSYLSTTNEIDSKASNCSPKTDNDHSLMATNELQHINSDQNCDSGCNSYKNFSSLPNVYIEYNSIKTVTLPHSPEALETKSFALAKLKTEFCLAMSSMGNKSFTRNSKYVTFVAANFILYLWVGIPFLFIVDQGSLLGHEHATFLASAISIGRLCGQLVFGYIGDLKFVNCIVIYGLSICITGIAVLLEPMFTSFPAMISFSILFGFFVSVTYVLGMMCIIHLVGLQHSTGAFGLFQLPQGISTILGTPLAGYIFIFFLVITYNHFSTLCIVYL